MSLVAPVNLLDHTVKENFNINLLRECIALQAKQENILEKLVFMVSFEEMSKWVEIHSDNQRFIANPSNASSTDFDECLTKIQEPLVLALKNIEKRRKNGRDRRIIEAVETDNYFLIADILASTASSYWRDHRFFNNEKNLKIASFFKNEEKNQQNKYFKKAQIDHIGAAVDFKKAYKKGALQEYLDFEETEEILKTFDYMVA